MAETAGYNGFIGYRAAGLSTDKSLYTAIAAITSASLNYQCDVLDISALDDATGMRVFLGGIGGVSISIEGFFFSGDTPQDALRTASGFTGVTPATVAICIAPDGSNGYVGLWWVESFEQSAPVDGVSTYSATLRLTGVASATA